MTKDVLITICGIQKRDGETDEPIETVTPGEYYFRNGNIIFSMKKFRRELRK